MIDRTSKKFNLWEAIIVYGLILLSMWLFIGYLELQLGMTVFGIVGYGIMGILGIWAIFLSPRFHSDTGYGIGFAAPFEIFTLMKNAEEDEKPKLLARIIGIALFALFVVWTNWEYILRRLGIGRDPELLNALLEGPFSFLYLGLFALVLFLLLSFFLVRWDNLWSALKLLLPVGLVFWSAIVVTGVIYASIGGDWSQFQKFQLGDFITHAGFYSIWGLLQQWLFLGYFNTRIRKGIENRKYGFIHGKYLTALLTGVCFGAIHIPAWPLTTLTFIGGTLFGYFFQKDKYRNLFIMGIAHGVGGTIVGQLTPMIMVVGPWVV